MRIVYTAATCSDRVYAQLFTDTQQKPSFQSQKYHKLLIEGLAAHCRVDVVATPPANRKTTGNRIVPVPSHQEGGANYHHNPAVGNPYLKGLIMGVSTFFRTFCLAGKDSVVVTDCLNRVVSLSTLLAARLRGRRCVGIVMDLPDMFHNGRKFYTGLANWVIAHCTDYIVLTEDMNTYINPTGKPYVVLEGQADAAMADRVPSLARKTKPRVLLYAGGVSREYGLEALTQGFLLADIPDTQLQIYGPGDYVEELARIGKENSRVRYGGVILSSQVVEKEQEATLLVNPRPTTGEYVKYSFPSKIMEYMSSGTPVATTVLPGMPKSYYPYVTLLKDESAQGIAQTLKELMAHSDKALFQMGSQARDYILKEKNNIVQAKKILDMLETTGK